MRIISKKTGLQAGAMVAVAAAGFGLISFSGDNVYRSTLTQLRALAHLSPGQTPTGPGAGTSTPPTGTGAGAGDGASAPSTAVWPLLKSGARGVNVTTAQHLLAAAGQSVTADGIYGPNTRNAAAAFQRSHRLTADGIIGPNTWNKLVNGTKTTTPTQPAPTTPAPASGRLTHRQALAARRGWHQGPGRPDLPRRRPRPHHPGRHRPEEGQRLHDHHHRRHRVRPQRRPPLPRQRLQARPAHP
ncbi:peptidoglycan-binding protein [Streptomyces sp. NPDC058240]|uniref:peptidoglycan-binding domain-containing protein n=1 Tax=Streptomyces sp. NPDC058240 TaxID=3346396 RepID=UPI0036E89EEA